MASNTTPNPKRNVLAAAATALLVTSAVITGTSLAAVGTASAAPVEVTECTTIDEAGTYELTNDITRSYDITRSDDPCFRVTASDVTFDGNEHTIDNLDVSRPVFATESDDGLENVTVRDVRIMSAGTTVEFDGVTDARIADVTVRSTAFPIPGAIEVAGDGNTITGVTGAATLSVVGDDNRVVDTNASGFDEAIGLSVDGDRNLVRNVDANGQPAVHVSGADNRVANSSIEGVRFAGLHVRDATGTVVIDNTLETGVRLENSTETSIRDNDADASSYGVFALELVDSDDNTIRNNDLDDSFETPLAFGLVDSDDNTIRGNAIEGIDVDNESGSNLVYDNVLVGVSVESGAESNRWNVTPRSGENVIGGDTIAGNYYANADGNGFSQSCEDADGDGLCDAPNEFDGSNADYVPLAGPDPAPVANGQSPTDPDVDGRYEDVDGDGEVTYNDVVVLFEYFGDAAVRDHADAYDFDGSGDVTYNDVVALVGEV